MHDYNKICRCDIVVSIKFYPLQKDQEIVLNEEKLILIFW